MIIRNTEVIEFIVKAMRVQMNNADMCKQGCDTFRCITYDNGKTNNNQHSHKLLVFTAGNRVTAGKAGAIEAIVEAMKTHIDNDDVCENGCCALANITTNGK